MNLSQIIPHPITRRVQCAQQQRTFTSALFAAVTLLSFCPSPLHAEQAGDFTYSIKDNAATITKYTGAGSEVTIPEKIGNLPVRSISDSAFNKLSATGITIPSSVTSIGENGFRGCKGLRSIAVDAANSKYRTVDGVLFNAAGTVLIQYPSAKPGASYSIPAGVIYISEGAFSGCAGLTGITIPTSVTAISRYAFSGCTGLTGLTIPASVTKLGDSLFYGCTALTTIPSGLTTIGVDMFNGCTGLTKVAIPPGVTGIEQMAFSGCTGLTDITLAPSVTKIGRYAFWRCTGLNRITIPPGVTNIGEAAFSGCTGLNDVLFAGNAPATFGNSVFDNVAAGIKVRYVKGATGFTKPEWKGCKTVETATP